MPARARILVVEDEPRLGEILRLYLERDGHQVTVVTDGRAAIAAVDAEPVDLVVLDLMLPGVNGEAVLTAIRDRGDTPVLIASAKAKGRVERANGTLQDRLVKEMGYPASILSWPAMRSAGLYGEVQCRFAKVPLDDRDVHRTLVIGHDDSRRYLCLEGRTHGLCEPDAAIRPGAVYP